MNRGVRDRLNALADCCNGMGTGLATLVFNLLRLPFAFAFGWPDPTQDALERQQLLHDQYRELQEKSDEAARVATAKGD